MSKRMLIVIGALVVVAVLFFIQNGKNGNAQSDSGSGGCQVQVTADILNVRSGPSTSAKVVGTLKTGATQAATKTTKNGFRELSAGHWASEDFLKPVAGSC